MLKIVVRLNGEFKLRVSENEVKNQTCGRIRDVTLAWEKLHNEELRNLHC
jgi:hypothetical protein